MKKFIIKKNEDGISLNKYLKKIFVNMPLSTYNKLLRKKYFEINNKKASGKEELHENDVINVFLSDETFEKFIDKKSTKKNNLSYSDRKLKHDTNKKNIIDIKNNIVYEDDNVIIYDKEEGLLSQGDKTNDVSVNTILNGYLKTDENRGKFVPSAINRLDRNTRGIIIFAKTYIAAKTISQMIKSRNVEKHYIAVVNGIIKKNSDRLVNLLKKDEKNNKVTLKEYKENVPDGYSKVELEYKVVKKYKNATLVDINLITGKSHQIRAQFSFIGHPLIADKKYMNYDLYKENVEEYGEKTQRLICYKIKFGIFDEDKLKNLDNKEFKIDYKTFIDEDKYK